MKGVLDLEERVEDISESRGLLLDCGFHRIGVAREGLGKRSQSGIDSAYRDHQFLRGLEGAGNLFLEVTT